jgi:hypothetical protein
MPKCFFSLKDSSDTFEASLGLAYFDEQSKETPTDYARAIAHQLQSNSAYHACFVIAMEQSGKEIARVPVGSTNRARDFQDSESGT